MDKSLLDKIQFWLLAVISLLFLWYAPEVWRYTPDGGIYIGTAETMVKEGRYWFNGHPNLQYYPGVSSLLSLPILVFGLNFHVMHLLTSSLALAALWLSRAYFPQTRYGFAGLVVPIMIACTGFFQTQAFRILSDGAFLAVSMAALLFWRVYVEKGNRIAFWSCLIFIAFASLLRFHGLFLCAAFGLALFLDSIRKDNLTFRPIAAAICWGGLSFLPFAAWTLRNFILHTPDTHNMANRFFFGLKGLPLSVPGFGKADWIDADWKYPLYRLYYEMNALADGIFGVSVDKEPFAEIALLALIGLVVLGSIRWFKRSTSLEAIYVALLVLFFAYSTLKSQNLYIVTRYWLPLLPVILVSGALGVGLLYTNFTKFRLNILTGALGGLLLILSVQNGVTEFMGHISPEKDAYYRNARDTIENLARFVKQKTDHDDTIATTDWGVLPLALGRQSYVVPRGDTNNYTLKSILKYKSRFIVILKGGITYPMILKIIERNPNIFNPLAEYGDGNVGPVGAVYEIDLEQVRRALRDKP